MIIRKGGIKDRSAAVRLLRASSEGAGFNHAEGPTGFHFPFKDAYAERLFDAHRMSPDGCALLLEVEGEAGGILIARAAEHHFGPVRLAQETAWWIDPKHRNFRAASRMLDAYEDWAFTQQKCQFVGMGAMGHDPIVAKLYERRGYRLAETFYLKASAP